MSGTRSSAKRRAWVQRKTGGQYLNPHARAATPEVMTSWVDPRHGSNTGLRRPILPLQDRHSRSPTLVGENKHLLQNQTYDNSCSRGSLKFIKSANTSGARRSNTATSEIGGLRRRSQQSSSSRRSSLQRSASRRLQNKEGGFSRPTTENAKMSALCRSSARGSGSGRSQLNPADDERRHATTVTYTGRHTCTCAEYQGAETTNYS